MTLPGKRATTRKKPVPSLRQRKAFEIWVEQMAKNEPIAWKEIMLRAGFSANSALNPQFLTLSRGWQELKKELDGEGAKNAFNDLVSRDNEDKRVRLAAAIEITKIQGGYPAQENKVIGIFGNLGELQKKDDRPENITTEDSVYTPPGSTESPGEQQQ